MGIFVTIFDPIGSAEGLVHELGHLRLHCLGIDRETHDGYLLSNSDDEKYLSPVRRDILRPMSAVFHALYSWTMLTELDLHIGSPAIPYLSSNVVKVENGLIEMKHHARFTKQGESFFLSFYQWCENVIVRGHLLLEEMGVDPVPDDRPIPTH
jgi:hypothetical protein